MRRKVWLWLVAALPLIGVLLIAQQAWPEETVAPTAAPAADASPAADKPEPAARDSTPADERLSADNSLSFPVDI